MKKTIPMEISNYRKLKEDNYYVVDKSMIIYEFLELKNEVTLITRPRCFGSTLNLNMIAEFFDITKDSREIFADTEIMNTKYANQINTYPVIHLSFANAKGDLKIIVNQIKLQLMMEYEKYEFIIKDYKGYDKSFLDQIQRSFHKADNSDLTEVVNAIYLLSKCLELYYHRKVMVLIDEVDTPYIQAQLGGFYDELSTSYSGMLSIALKDNKSLQYAMLTGVQIIMNESIYSGLNNLNVCSIAARQYTPYFGFTEKETTEVLNYYGLEYNDQVKSMYGGYCIDNQNIFNPWSIMNFAFHKELKPYWINASANKLIIEAICTCKESFRKKYELLSRDGYIETTVKLETSLPQSPAISNLWGYLLNEGYLTIQKTVDAYDSDYQLKIPNQEVIKEFTRIVHQL